MAMLLLNLKKTLLHSPLLCRRASTNVLLLLRYSSSSTSPIRNPDSKPHFIFMEDYLITTCGFPPDSASRLAKRLTRLQSPQIPDSVIRSLKHYGFEDAQIRRLITWYSPLLCSNVVEPNMRILLDMGFSGSELPRVVIRNPGLLTLSNIGPRIQFWRILLGNDQKKLRLAFERNPNLITRDIAKNVTPKIGLFKKHGLSDLQIQRIIIRGGHILGSSMASIEALLSWALDLGIPTDSSVFAQALYTLYCTGRAGFKAQMELLNKYGWAEYDFLSAFQKYPNFAAFSHKSIQTKMDFLVGRAGCTPSYIALHPSLLGYSLEKRLMPRNLVMQILKAKEVGSWNILSIVQLGEKMFLEKFIPQYKEEVPELREIYLAACAGQFLLDPYQHSMS